MDHRSAIVLGTDRSVDDRLERTRSTICARRFRRVRRYRSNKSPFSQLDRSPSTRTTVPRNNASFPKVLLPVSSAAYRTPIAHDPGGLGFHLNERTSRFKPSLPTSCTYWALIYVNICICLITYIHIYIQIYHIPTYLYTYSNNIAPSIFNMYICIYSIKSYLRNIMYNH